MSIPGRTRADGSGTATPAFAASIAPEAALGAKSLNFAFWPAPDRGQRLHREPLKSLPRVGSKTSSS